MAVDYKHSINVLRPRKLPLWQIPAERIPVGIPGDYKPTLALMPDGELVMAALYAEMRQDGTYREWTPFWRSRDGGRTWFERVVLRDVLGREQWLTATSKGTLFMTSHFLPNDAANKEGVCFSFLHRSTDGGRTWQRTEVLLRGEERRGQSVTISNGGHTSRNVVEMPDGALLLGVSINHSSVAYLWASRDNGETWEHGEPVAFGTYRGRPYDNADGFFAEDFTYRCRSGKLLHWIRCGPPSPMYPMEDGRATPERDDQGDRTLMCESRDNGRTWDRFRDFGEYAMMYIRALRLRDGRLLLTHTQRSLFPPLGLRAMLSYDDGKTWDFDNDRLILEGKTPWGLPSGGGFGNTLEMDDGTLVTAYTYRGADRTTHLEVMRWRLPISNRRPYFIPAGALEPGSAAGRVTLCDWSRGAGAEVLPYDVCQRDSGAPQAVITRAAQTVGGEAFGTTLEFLSAAETGDSVTGVSFRNLPVRDLTGYLGVAMRVHNPSDEPQSLAIWARDRVGDGPHRVQTFGPGESGLLFLTIDEIQFEADLSDIREIILLAFDPKTRRRFLAGPLYVAR